DDGVLTPSCAARKTVRRVSVQDMINVQMDSVQVLNLYDSEIQMLTEMNRPRLYDDKANFLLDPSNTTATQALFQIEAQRLQGILANQLSLAHNYFDSQRNVGTLLFDIDGRVQKVVKC